MYSTSCGRGSRHPELADASLAPDWPRRRTARYRLRGLVAAVVIAALCGGASGESIRIDGADYLGDLPTVIAAGEGLFARRGLDAEVRYNSSGKQSLARLRAGETDVALCALTPLVIDRLSDPTPGGAEDPVILANLLHSTHINRVVVRSDLPAVDLAGTDNDLRVALPKGTNAEFAWWVFTIFQGLDPSRFTVHDQPAHAIAGLLASGEADAAVVREPWIARMRRRGLPIETVDADGRYTAKWVLVTSGRVVATRPRMVRSLLAVYRDAVELIERSPKPALARYARRVGVDPQAQRPSWHVLDYDLGLDWSLIATLQQQIDWAREHYGAAVSEVAVLSMIDPVPLHDLYPWAVAIPHPRLTAGPAE